MTETAFYRFPPIVLFGASALVSALVCAVAVWLALAQPQFGLPDGATLTRVGAVTLVPSDLAEEPDQLGGYAAEAAFFDRQDQLASELGKARVAFEFTGVDGVTTEQDLPRQSRRLSDLAAVFWFQLAVGALGAMIGGWVFSLRREDPGALMFAVTGVNLLLSAASAAVYSTRQIAIDGNLFAWLAGVNHASAAGFGVALVGMWIMYPRPLVRPAWIWLIAAVYALPITAEFLWLATRGTLGSTAVPHYAVVMSEMALAIVFGFVQWFRSRRQPLARAGLRWFLLASLVGCSLFIAFSVAPVALGLSQVPLISQGYAFGFFLVMHAGLALGLLRYRVFDLDRYAWYVWLWLASALLVLALDLLVLQWMRAQPWASLTVALLLASFLYFPLRQFLLRRIFSPNRPSIDTYLPAVIGVAMAPSRVSRNTAWLELMQRVYSPGAVPEQMSDAKGETATLCHARIDENGLALIVPGGQDLPTLRLRYADHGRRLFRPDDESLGNALRQMEDVARQGREAYERGIAEERDRISRDVHDNIGAQVLSALHTTEPGRKNDLLRDTLSDLRNIINEGFRSRYALGEVLADLRLETAERLAAVDIALEWPVTGTAPDETKISFLQAAALRSILREAISNIIKHSGARLVRVAPNVTGDALDLALVDDGRGFDPTTIKRGMGLANISTRAVSVDGHAVIEPAPEGGTRLSLHLPLAREPREGVAVDAGSSAADLSPANPSLPNPSAPNPSPTGPAPA